MAARIDRASRASRPLPASLLCLHFFFLLLAHFLLLGAHAARVAPLSPLDPVAALGFARVARTSVGGGAPIAANWRANATPPLPTNAWWENVALGDGSAGGASDEKNRSGSGLDGSPTDPENNVFALPYVVLPEAAGVGVAVPYPFEAGTTQFMNGFDATVMRVSLAAVELDAGAASHVVSAFDELSVTLEWRNSAAADASPNSTLRSTIVRGDAFVSAFYRALTPLVRSPMALLGLAVDGGAPIACDGSVVAVNRFAEFSFLESDATWRAYVSEPLHFTCAPQPFALVAKAPLVDGVFRVAMVNNCTRGTSAQHCPPSARGRGVAQKDYAALVDAAADAIVVGAALSWNQTAIVSGSAAAAANVAQYHYYFDWRFVPLRQGLSAPLPLIFAMPHHIDSFDRASTWACVHNATGMPSIRGMAVPVVAATWHLVETAPAADAIAFAPPRRPDADKLETLLMALHADAAYDLPLNYQTGVGDPYFAGKMMERMARLALIADELNQTAIVGALVARVKPYLQTWLLHTSANPLVYDASWGGLVSCGCNYDDCGGKCKPHCDNGGPPDDCPSLVTPGQDFGNAFYNDHHFHYGYHVYTAAVIAHFDPTWAVEYGDRVLLMLRDVMNPSDEDAYFPVFRHKDWYSGHSWASGIALAGAKPFFNGRNQESTSEAVNFYYAAALWARATADAALATLSDLMLATEIRGAWTYWQVTDDTVVYPPDFAASKVVGIMWTHLAQQQTWFGGAPYLVHGIQQLPSTPVNEWLLRRVWVAQESAVFARACAADASCAALGWNTLVCLNRAVIDKAGAWQCALALPDANFDNDSAAGNGHSRANTYHWIATRP